MHYMRAASYVFWGQNEDCSPGESVSDNSEKLLEVSGGAGIYRSFSTKDR